MRYTAILLLVCFARLAPAQITYTIDSTSFNALSLDGGKTEVAVADINQDGHPDLLTVGDHGSPFINTNQHGISVFFGNGTAAGWTLFQSGDFGYGGIAVGDVNNDRYPDVAYGIHHDYSSTDFGDQLLEAAIGDGTGTAWVPWDDSLATAGESYGMMGTDLGDVNNDGWLDIGSGSFGCCAGTHVYLNMTNGSWTHSYGYTGGNTSKYFEFGDLNHDGNLDFVCCHQSAAAYFGDGTGNFTPSQFNLPATGNLGFGDVSLADVDNDGDDDFAFLQGSLPYVYTWNGATMQWVSLSAGLPATGTYSDIKLADLDMDGFADLIAARDQTVEIWNGNGGTQWSLSQSFVFADMDDTKDLAVGDLDHNGFPDVLFWSEYYISWFTYENRLRLIRENSVAAALSMSLQYPGHFECLPAGSVRFIDWISAIPQNHASSVKIEFSTAGPSGPWTTVETDMPNNNRYQWDVPVGVVSTNCFLRLTALDSVTLDTISNVNIHPFQVGVCNPALALQEPVNGGVAGAYPNPFREFVRISSPFPDFNLALYNIFGQEVVARRDIAGFSYLLDRGLLEPGFYIARIDAEGQPPVTVKLVAE